MFLICFVVAIAEVYKNEGNNEYNKKNFTSAVDFYSEGIKVNCKDEDLNAKLYSNRAAAHFNLGKSCYILALKYLTFWSIELISISKWCTQKLSTTSKGVSRLGCLFHLPLFY